MNKQNDFSTDTPFTQLVGFIENYNRENPKKKQPITNEILSMLNELGGIGLQTAWKDAGFLNFAEYQEDIKGLNDLLQSSHIKGISINFGHTVAQPKSDLLHAQIQSILKKHLINIWPSDEKKRGRGQPRARWQRVVTQGKPIIEKLYTAGITSDFLATFFNTTPETFKRKIPK